MISPKRVLGSGVAGVAAIALTISGFALSTQAAVVSPDIIKPTAGTTQINLIGFNDFHGRIAPGAVKDGTQAPSTPELFASTVFQAQNAFGADKSIVISNGDAVGASIFESAVQKDEPTIDVLNAMGVQVYTQGNHEFDGGADDAENRIAPRTGGHDLAANVLNDRGERPFKSYATFEVSGFTVAVVGAVTKDVPGLVSPDGIKGYTFEDPVAAVNRVTDELTDGDPANGEAQIIIASYHEGGPIAGSDKFEQNMQNDVFKHIVNDTSPKVAAIYNAHTHMPYAYDAPVPGGSTRPVVQSNSYAGSSRGDAAAIGQIVLTVDAQGKVTGSESSLVPLAKSIPAELAGDSRLAEIKRIVDESAVRANELGKREIGTQSQDITRAKVCEGGFTNYNEAGQLIGCDPVKTPDDRAQESSLGRLVANSMHEAVAETGREVDVALMNPGGLRADISNDDGKITYREAAAVLPFANTITHVQLDGASLKQVLEEQWQPDGSSRPYLQLGISDNLTYAADPSRERGDRITAVTIDGEPLDPARVYNIATPNFLAAGGDNFASFTNAKSVTDTGLIDLESFVNWIQAKGSIDAPINRAGVNVGGYQPNMQVAAGGSIALEVGRMDLNSLAHIRSNAVIAKLEGGDINEELGMAEISGEPQKLELTVPRNVPAGNYSVKLYSIGSDTVVTLPVEVTDFPTETQRLAGPNRYESAVAVSQQHGIVGNPVFLATGERPADALAAGPAAASVDGSLLLTPPTQMLPSVAGEIKRLQPSTIYVIGDEKTITSTVVKKALDATGGKAEIVRIGGANRVETSVKIAETFFPEAEGAYIANGWTFADALSASSAGALENRPVLLTQVDTLSAPILPQVKKLKTVTLVGSERAVSAAVESAIRAANSELQVARGAGENRYETNISLNEAVAGRNPEHIVVATGEKFPDALVASVIVDRLNAPLVLTTGTCVVQRTSDYLTNATPYNAHIVGDDKSVADNWNSTICK